MLLGNKDSFTRYTILYFFNFHNILNLRGEITRKLIDLVFLWCL